MAFVAAYENIHYRLTLKWANISLYDRLMEQDCHICRNKLNLQDRYSVQICQKKHQCCAPCFQQIIRRRKQCPFCRIYVSLEQAFKRKKQALKDKQIKMASITRKLKVLQEMDKTPKLSQQSKNAIIWKEYRRLRQSQGFYTGCLFLKEQIQEQLNYSQEQLDKQGKPMIRGVTNDEQFIGLGTLYEQQGFSEQFGYEWYQERYNLPELSLYDQLALVLRLEKHNIYITQDINWYNTIIGKNPSNFKAIFGLQSFSKPVNKQSLISLKPFQKIFELKPDFDKPYEIIAFMYLEFNCLNEAFRYATQCLKRNPNNIFAKYISAASDTNLTSQEKQQKLSKIIGKEPTYVRVRYALGKQYSKIGKQKQAIEIYEKCIQINKHYLYPLIDWAISLIEIFQNKAAVELLQKWYNKLAEQYKIKDNCNYYLGVAYQNLGQLQRAANKYLNVSPYHGKVTSNKLANICYKACFSRSALEHLKNFDMKISTSKSSQKLCTVVIRKDSKKRKSNGQINGLFQSRTVLSSISNLLSAT